ncbi:MAG TPA: hypothetical protein EYG92_01395 [Lutibacter sp.]|nr:hypothetical protein [Lutibacter sp.]
MSDEFTDYTEISDSVSIVSKEVIDGNTFYKFKRISTRPSDDVNRIIGYPNGESNYFLRDSIGFLIDDKHEIKFVNNSFDAHFIYNCSSCDVNFYGKLINEKVEVFTEAGNFECLDMELHAVSIEDNHTFPGRSHYYYSDGVGNIRKDISWVSSDKFFEKRLVSYEVQ